MLCITIKAGKKWKLETSKEDETTVDERDKMQKGKSWGRQKVNGGI